MTYINLCFISSMVPEDNNFYDWVAAHSADDTSKLRFKYAGKTGDIDYTDAILQIDCRRKYARKLSATLAAAKQFYFPDTLSGEQSTSDLLTSFHASLVSDADIVADMTAGLGIDCMHIASRAREVIAVERQEKLAEALRHNAATLGISNITVICDDCHEYLKTVADNSFSHVFIDPARRDDSGRRVYALSQCSPDVVAMLPDLRRVASTVIVKMSPMLDISAVLSELPGTSKIISLGTATECKELIAVMAPHTESYPSIEAVTILNDGSENCFTFSRPEETDAPVPVYGTPSVGDYVYEPWPALMKAGVPKLICSRYSLRKPAPNTMVFFSDEKCDDFPGTAYEVAEVITYESKNIKRLKKTYPVISVATRNFDISADALRSKLGVKEGGDLRLLGISDDHHRKYMLILRRV